MRRLLFLYALCAAVACGDAQQDVIDLLGRMTSALSEGAADGFLRAIDPAMPGYTRFADSVNALTSQNTLSNSAVIVSQSGDDRLQVVELNWILEIKGQGDSHVFVRREAMVKCKIERQKKKWRVITFDPDDFFAPPTSDAR